MEKSFVHAALKNQKVLRIITLIVQAELEDLSTKLTEKEAKLKSVEDENVQLVIKLGKLQLYLETADEVEKKCKEEITRLKDELQKSIQNLEERENAFKTLEKHSSQAIGDYTAECMVLKKRVGEKQAELEISTQKINTLEERVLQLEKLVEKKTAENERLEQEINNGQPKVDCRIGAKKGTSPSTSKSVSLHVLSKSSTLPPLLKQREVSLRLTRLSLPSPSVKTSTHIGSFQNAVAIPENDNHEDAKKHVYKNGFKRRFCKCGLSFRKIQSLNRHISQKATPKNSNNNTASRECVREVHNTTSDFARSQTGSQTLISSSPKTTNNTSTEQEHCAINLDITGQDGRVHCKCGKPFPTKSELSKHILQESSGRIFRCTLCDKSFLRHETLKKHMHGLHKKKNYNGFGCRRCGQVFDSSSKIVIHRLKDH